MGAMRSVPLPAQRCFPRALFSPNQGTHRHVSPRKAQNWSSLAEDRYLISQQPGRCQLRSARASQPPAFEVQREVNGRIPAAHRQLWMSLGLWDKALAVPCANASVLPWPCPSAKSSEEGMATGLGARGAGAKGKGTFRASTWLPACLRYSPGASFSTCLQPLLVYSLSTSG